MTKKKCVICGGKKRVWLQAVKSYVWCNYCQHTSLTAPPENTCVASVSTPLDEPYQFIEPALGMGVTCVVGSDRYPYTVVRILSPKRIVVAEDQAIRTDNNGQSESQTYDYDIAKGERLTLTLRSDGKWREEKTVKNSGRHWRIGFRQAYRDPSF